MPVKVVKPDTFKTKITETVYSLIDLRGKNEVDRGGPRSIGMC